MVKGVELTATPVAGLVRVDVNNPDARYSLSWDRFQRLQTTAASIEDLLAPGDTILDIGGYDGALALFLPDYQVDMLDPLTTSGSTKHLLDSSYKLVVSVDVLEHVTPEDRESFLQEQIRLTNRHCLINFPSRRTAEAQRLVFELTANPLVKDHAQWELPEGPEVAARLQQAGFDTRVIEHTSLTQWLSQYVLQALAPDAGHLVNAFLLAHHDDEPCGTNLYDLVIGTRAASN
jgi:hypothetical protein